MNGPNFRRENIYIYVNEESDITPIAEILQRGVLVGKIRSGGMDAAIEDAPSWSIIPSFLVIDIRGIEDTVGALEALSHAVPGGETSLILLGEDNNIETYRQYTNSGAADYLPMPATADSIFESVARIASQKAPHDLDESRCIAFVGIRGGVGTSTLAAATTEIIVDQHDRRAILIDFDTTNGAQCMIFGKNPTNGLSEMLKSPERVDSVFLQRSIQELRKDMFLLCSNEPKYRDQYPKDAARTIIRQSQEGIDMVVCDIPYHPQIDPTVVANAGTVFLCTFPTLLGLRDTMHFVEQLNETSFPGKIIIVLTHTGEKTGFDVPKDHFEKNTHAPVIEIPYDPKTPARAMRHQEPFHSINGKMAKGLEHIAEELPTYIPKEKTWRDTLNSILGK